MKAIIVDSSILMPLLLPDEESEKAEALIREGAAKNRLISSELCWLEVSNTLLMAVKRGRITSAQAVAGLQKFGKLPINYKNTVAFSELPAVYLLAEKLELSFYDATFLAAAKSLGAELATLDQKLRNAANAERVPLYAAT